MNTTNKEKNNITLEQAITLRKKLENDILMLLLNFHKETGLTPVQVVTEVYEKSSISSGKSLSVAHVHVAVEI